MKAKDRGVAIAGIGIQLIQPKSGAGPQAPPADPPNDRDADDAAAMPASPPRLAPPAPGTGLIVDKIA